MSAIRKKHNKEFKFKVAIEALKEKKTIVEICKEFSVCESQVNIWKKQLKENGSFVFENSSISSKLNNQAALETKIKQLNEYIGELSVENKFFKKKLNF